MASCGVWQREGSLTGFHLFKELSHEVVILNTMESLVIGPVLKM